LAVLLSADDFDHSQRSDLFHPLADQQKMKARRNAGWGIAEEARVPGDERCQ
jgi:hypothetical protein